MKISEETLPPGIPEEAVPHLREVGDFQDSPTRVGDPVPALQLFTPSGQATSIAELWREKPAVLVFAASRDRRFVARPATSRRFTGNTATAPPSPRSTSARRIRPTSGRSSLTSGTTLNTSNRPLSPSAWRLRTNACSD